MLTFFKKVFYRAIPTAHISAYIRFLYLQKALKKVKFRNILDAGCGPGLFSFYIAKKYPEARVTGYDISPLDIETCNKKKNSDYINNVSFYCVDIRTPFHDKNFDFIFSIDVFEHILGNIKVLENVWLALKHGGQFYLAMPQEPGHRFLFPKRYFHNYISWSKKEHIGEQYDLATMSAILRKIGFLIEDARYTFGFWGKLAWELDLLTDCNKTIKHLLQPFLFTWGYMDTLWKNNPQSYAIRIIARK